MANANHETRAVLRRPLVLAGISCLVPYAGLIALFWFGHESTIRLERPDSAYLSVLAVLGGMVPLAALTVVFVRVVRDTSTFRPLVMVELYLALIVVFASLYSLVQSASAQPAFANTPMLWDGDGGLAFDQHLDRVHAVFGTMLYLSVVTVTTLGYGDITPASVTARLLTAVQALVGVSFVTVSVGHYFSVCAGRR